MSGEAPAGEGVAAPYLHWLDEPAPPERMLLRRVLVRIARGGRLLACDGGDLGLSPGEQVLVDSPDGRRLGAVEGSPVVMLHEGEPLPAVVRRGAREDRRKERSLQDQEGRARQTVREEMDPLAVWFATPIGFTSVSPSHKFGLGSLISIIPLSNL